MATHLVIEAADVTKRGLRDAAAHRQGVAPVYNAYTRVSGDPAFAGKQGDYQALLRPLFMLSFLVDDFLAENEFYGAKSVMLSSASSKTAYGLAHLLHARGNGIKVIGLTSAGNTSFVKSLGCYDEVVTYDNVTSLPANSAVAYVDMAGNSPLRATLHGHFGEQMKYSGIIGLTHRKSSPDERAQVLPGAKPQFFFAPDQIRKRTKEWGPAGFSERWGAAWSGFAPNLDQWMKVIREPWACGGATRLSRHPQRPRAAGSGADPVAYRNRPISPHALSAPSRMGIGFAEQGNAAKTAGDGKRPCSTGRTTVRLPPTIGLRSSRKRSESPMKPC